MASVQTVLSYLSSIHRSDIELDHHRALLLLYLVDWRSAITRHEPVTNVTWKVEDFGPQPDSSYVLSGVMSPADWNAVSNRSRVEADRTTCDLAIDEREVIDFVAKAAGSKSDEELQRLVYSTFPVMTQPKHAPLNLVALAERYNREFPYSLGR